MKTEVKKNMRWWVPLMIVAVVVVILSWMEATDHFMRGVVGVLLPVLGLFLVGLWYVFLTGASWRQRGKRFLMMVVVVLLGVGALSQTRWEGSTGGDARPRLVWKWTPRADERVEAIEAATAEGDGLDAGEIEGLFMDYPRYMGPDGTGVLAGIELETDWEAEPPEELWRIPMGVGWSGFVVSGRYAVTQEQRGEDELVTCYDLLTGDLIWAHRDGGRFVETMGGDGPRATPAIEGDRVYAQGATGILNCLNLKTGELVWSRDVLGESGVGNLYYGKTNSPLVVGDLVVVTGGDRGPTLLAYEKATGESAWKVGSEEASYASPQLVTIEGEEQVVIVSANSVTGHKVESGEEIWRYDWPSVQGMPRSSQAAFFDEDKFLLTASYNYDNYVIETEMPEGEVEMLWEGRPIRTKFSNVSLKDGYGYGLNEGRLACVDLETGEQLWRGGKYGFGQNILVGDILLIQGERGFVSLVSASPEGYEELARLDAMDGKTWNYPALAGSYLLVRNDQEAVCYRIPVLGSFDAEAL
ncbi:MAG: PQQ-binding-like beta-propeller repeat protein [Verrucomicrobiota bacterium]